MIGSCLLFFFVPLPSGTGMMLLSSLIFGSPMPVFGNGVSLCSSSFSDSLFSPSVLLGSSFDRVPSLLPWELQSDFCPSWPLTFISFFSASLVLVACFEEDVFVWPATSSPPTASVDVPVFALSDTNGGWGTDVAALFGVCLFLLSELFSTPANAALPAACCKDAAAASVVGAGIEVFSRAPRTAAGCVEGIDLRWLETVSPGPLLAVAATTSLAFSATVSASSV
mmetsp:Transcript_24964/g.68845  ORF Transcript_24964/g.68845 Transcript_24964/m.68845 type:complete len:225 (+) Transcript_24964:796-1470(+)